MAEAVERYLSLYRDWRLDEAPCTAAEIEAVEAWFGRPLPTAYRAYLRHAGRAEPTAWVGSDARLEVLPDLQQWARDLLVGDGQPPLPEGAFAFAMHQGYQFHWFVADGTDDPPTRHYMEGGEESSFHFDRFSDLIAQVAADGRELQRSTS